MLHMKILLFLLIHYLLIHLYIIQQLDHFNSIVGHYRLNDHVLLILLNSLLLILLGFKFKSMIFLSIIIFFLVFLPLYLIFSALKQALCSSLTRKLSTAF